VADRRQEVFERRLLLLIVGNRVGIDVECLVSALADGCGRSVFFFPEYPPMVIGFMDAVRWRIQ